MNREMFINVSDLHFEICKNIIENDGACHQIKCADCPFDFRNATNGKTCKYNKYNGKDYFFSKDIELFNSAKDFLKLNKGEK